MSIDAPRSMKASARHKSLLRDLYKRFKLGLRRPQTSQILQRLERLFPLDFGNIDAAISQAYLAVFEPDPSNSLIFVLMRAMFAITLSISRSILDAIKEKTNAIFAGNFDHPGVEGIVSPSNGGQELINNGLLVARAVLVLVGSAIKDTVHLIYQISLELCQLLLDADRDGVVGMGDLSRSGIICVQYVIRAVVYIVSNLYYLFLIILRMVVENVLPPTTRPATKPKPQLHQPTTSPLTRTQLRLFEYSQTDGGPPLSIGFIVSLAYNRVEGRVERLRGSRSCLV